MDVEVLGTHFNINAYEDERIIKTTLLQGSVKVSKGNESVLIKPGEQAAVVDMPNANSQKMKVQNVDVDDVVAWKNGFFSFKHSGLVEITMQLSRWYDIDVAYKGNIEEQEFTGKIDRSLNLGQVLKILERTGVHFKIDEGRKLTILP
jgi:ferric-dicitrate binding protein FerR (iron transport regulator)